MFKMFREKEAASKSQYTKELEVDSAYPCILKHCGGETYCECCGKRWDYGDYDGTCGINWRK